MPNNLNTPALPVLKQSDLKDATLIALNQNFSTIWQKVIFLAGGAGAVNIPNDFSAQSISVPAQTQPPTDPAQVLTLQSALALFAPSTTRTALTSGAFQTSPTAVAPSQPLPSTVVSSQAPTTSTSPGVPGQIAFDSAFLYICVSAGVWRRVATSSF